MGLLGVVQALSFNHANHCLTAVAIDETPKTSYEDFN